MDLLEEVNQQLGENGDVMEEDESRPFHSSPHQLSEPAATSSHIKFSPSPSKNTASPSRRHMVCSEMNYFVLYFSVYYTFNILIIQFLNYCVIDMDMLFQYFLLFCLTFKFSPKTPPHWAEDQKSLLQMLCQTVEALKVSQFNLFFSLLFVCIHRACQNKKQNF